MDELLAELVAEVSQVAAVTTEMLLAVQGAFEASIVAWLHSALLAVGLLAIRLRRALLKRPSPHGCTVRFPLWVC